MSGRGKWAWPETLGAVSSAARRPAGRSCSAWRLILGVARSGQRSRHAARPSQRDWTRPTAAALGDPVVVQVLVAPIGAKGCSASWIDMLATTVPIAARRVPSQRAAALAQCPGAGARRLMASSFLGHAAALPFFDPFGALEPDPPQGRSWCAPLRPSPASIGVTQRAARRRVRRLAVHRDRPDARRPHRPPSARAGRQLRELTQQLEHERSARGTRSWRSGRGSRASSTTSSPTASA